MNPVDEFRLVDVLALLLFVGVVGVVEALDDWFVLATAAPPLYGIKRDEYEGDGAWANEDVTVEGDAEEAIDDDVVYEGDEFERQIILHEGDDGGSELLLLFKGGLLLKSNVEFLLWSKCFSLVLFRAIDSNAGR